jgi:hypothetical protein
VCEVVPAEQRGETGELVVAEHRVEQWARDAIERDQDDARRIR